MSVMAKTKKRSNSKTKTIDNYIEIIGVLLILVSILGIGKYGVVGKVIASFSLFMVGSLYILLLVFLLGLGIYIVIKREKVDFFTSKSLGLYLIIIGVLVLLHQQYVLESIKASGIFTETVNVLKDGIYKIMNSQVKTGIFDTTLSNTGGGMIGATFGWAFYNLFDIEGSKIVVWVFIGSGFMVFTGFSIFNLIKNAKAKVKNMIPVSKVEEKVSKDDSKLKINDNNNPDYKNEDNKTVIKDISQLTHAIPVEQQKEVEKVETNKNYILPSLDLLDLPDKTKKNNRQLVEQMISENSKKLVEVLKDFGIYGKVVEVNIGPTVIQYELLLNQGTKVSKLLGINREIALALAKKDVRIQAPIPGKNTVGIEMPNEDGNMVTLRETLEDLAKRANNKKMSLITAALGKDIMGEVRWTEINKTPHLLVAGATGSGKSVCINGMIISILMRAKPDEVKLILVDPKKVELSIYNGIPHLLTPVVTDPKKASVALKKAVSEMERRYDLFEESKTKNIEGYNEYVEKQNSKIKFDEAKMQKLPYIVVIVDELADLMLVAGKEVEDSIMRITQMARAAGIHLIIATQRPSTDVITGLIKANIPSRISFAVSSSIDSRTILDMMGAEKLLGKGDMLYLPMGEIVPQRIQGAFVSEKEIAKVVDYTISQQKASYDGNFLNLDERDQEIKNNSVSGDKEEYDDPLYEQIVEFVITTGKASASLLQRRYKLGYNRAARIVDLLEERGIIGPQNGSKPREVLIKLEDENEYNE